MIRAYLHGWFGHKNIGDDLLLNEALRRLTEINDSVEIAVGCSEIDYLRPMLSGYPAVRAVKPMQGLFREAADAASSFDALIIGPGGLFPNRSVKALIWQSLVVAKWREKGRFVGYYFFGANTDVNAVEAFLWRRIAKTANCFVVRDSALLPSISMSEDDRIVSSEDLLFGADLYTGSQHDSVGSGKVAVAFANLYKSEEAGYEDFFSACREIVGEIVSDGYLVDLFSFTSGSDERLNSELASLFPNRVTYLSYESSLGRIDELSAYVCVVGMRFHSCVLAAKAGVPIIPISYSHKTTALANELGLSDGLTYFCKDDTGYFERAIPLNAFNVVASFRKVANELASHNLPPDCELEQFKEKVERGAEAFRLAFVRHFLP